MARDPKTIYRRTPNWCPELSALVEEVARLVKSKRIFFPRMLEYGQQTNTAGIVQGVLIEAAAHIASMTDEQWKRYVDVYTQMDFVQGVVQGLYLDEESVEAFSVVGHSFERRPLPKEVKLKWGQGYRIHMLIAITLQWFVDRCRNS